jgi:hypothetical protein
MGGRITPASSQMPPRQGSRLIHARTTMFELQSPLLPESGQPEVLLRRYRLVFKQKMQATRYDRNHKRLRAQMTPAVRSGKVRCSRCGLPIGPNEDWHLDHADDGNGYRGASHAYCNTTAPAAALREFDLTPYVVDDDGRYAEDAEGHLYRIDERGRPQPVSRRW